MLYDPSHLVLQGIDYLAYIDHYHSRIRMFHAKDAEFRPNGRTGVYGGYLPWVERAGRFRSLGMVKWISPACSRSSLSMIIPAGRWSNGNARSSIRRTERDRGEVRSRHIIRVTDKAFDDLPQPRSIRQPTGACWTIEANTVNERNLKIGES